jgi:hypothetical protein
MLMRPPAMQRPTTRRVENLLIIPFLLFVDGSRTRLA